MAARCDQQELNPISTRTPSYLELLWICLLDHAPSLLVKWITAVISPLVHGHVYAVRSPCARKLTWISSLHTTSPAQPMVARAFPSKPRVGVVEYPSSPQTCRSFIEISRPTSPSPRWTSWSRDRRESGWHWLGLQTSRACARSIQFTSHCTTVISCNLARIRGPGESNIFYPSPLRPLIRSHHPVPITILRKMFPNVKVPYVPPCSSIV